MYRGLLTICLALAFSHALPSQEAGYRNLTFPNTTGQGSSTLSARVYYPSLVDGQNVPMATPPAAGYPVVVFLHGLTAIGSFYSRLGEYLAKKGYVVVLNQTGQFSTTLQASDGAAFYPALIVANGQSGHPLLGALDMSHVGLAGHSYGASNAITILGSNPGYKACLCFAPVYQGASAPNQVVVPLGIIQSEGDLVLLHAVHGLNTYNAAGSFTGFKFNYLFDFSGGHNNVPGVIVITSADQAVWQQSKRVARSFLDRFLKHDESRMEQVIGAAAQAGAHLTNIYVEIEAPDVWLSGQPSIGQTVEIRTSSEPGTVLYGAAAATAAPLPTPFGDLLLDPVSLFVPYTATVASTRVATVSLPIPNNVALVGTQVAFQSLGLSNSGNFRLSQTATLVVEN